MWELNMLFTTTSENRSVFYLFRRHLALKKSKPKAQKQTEDTEVALSRAYSNSLTIAAIVGIGMAIALLALFWVADAPPSSEAANAYWRLDSFNLPISVLMATLAPTTVFAFLAICLKRWQSEQWPYLLALIGLISPMVWVHGLTMVDVIQFDGLLETGDLYLPPYPVFWSCVFLMAGLLAAGAIVVKVRDLIAR